MMKIKMIGAAVLAGAIVVGCEKEPEDTMAISVNGEKLMQSQIDADVAALVKAQGDRIPTNQLDYAKQMMANQVAQSFIVEKVLVAKAKAEKYVVTDADRKARTDEFLKAVAGSPDAPKSIDEYFKKFPLGEERARLEFENGILIDKMVKDHQAKVPAKDFSLEAKRIVDNIISNNAASAASTLEAEKKIKDLKKQLDALKGFDAITNRFAELAKTNSACQSSAKGGDLGEFTRGQMVKEFDAVAFTLPVGQVSNPVKTQFGWHLVLVTKKIPAVEAKGEIPAEPEKVQASHILIKAGQTQEVPKRDDVVKFLKKQADRAFLQDFVMKEIKGAKIEASEAYKQFLPPADEPTASAPAAPVEKSAQK